MLIRNSFILQILLVGTFLFTPQLATGQGTANSNAQVPSNAQDTPQDAENRQRAIDGLMSELNDLVPGDFDERPEKKAAALAIIEQFVSGNGDAAIGLIKKQSEVDPAFPPVELVVAALQYRANNPTMGKFNLEKVAREHPGYPGVFVALSRLALSQNRDADALALLEKVKRLIDEKEWTEDEESHFNLSYMDGMADLLIRYEKWEEASAMLNQIQTALPDNAKTKVRLAEISFRKGDFDQSLGLLTEFSTMEVNKNGRKPELMLASWFNQDGKTDEAQQWIVKAFEKYPEDVEVMAEYAEWMVSKENFAEAQTAIKKIEASKGGETQATKFVKGKIAFADGAYGLAEAHFSELSIREPGNFELANLWALSLIEIPDETKRKSAIQVAQRNVQIDPKNGVAIGILGWIHYKLGDLQQAQAWMQRATQTRTESPEVKFFIANLLKDRGETDQAKALLQEALKFEGVFLYRRSAKEMLNGLGDSDQLPEPGSAGG